MKQNKGKVLVLCLFLWLLPEAQSLNRKRSQKVGNNNNSITRNNVCRLEIAFILDSSESILHLLFDGEKAFVRSFGPRVAGMQVAGFHLKTRLALIFYSSSVHIDQHFTDWQDLDSFLTRLDDADYIGHGTYSTYAISNATQLFRSETTNQSVRVGLFLSDGIDHPLNPEITAALDESRRHNIRLFTIGLSNLAMDVTNSTRLRAMASSPAQQYFHSLTDPQLEERLLQQLETIAENECPRTTDCLCEKGEAGLPGVPGKQGNSGDDGPPGPQGSRGETGAPGLPGINGSEGRMGFKGAKGDPGCCGPTGQRGYKGTAGPEGPSGHKGEQGLKGRQGDQGPEGQAGPKGNRGLTGAPGAPGENGIGFPGAKGDKGKRGSVGLPGQIGIGQPGLPGPAGEPGVDGEPGAPGLGPPGSKGERGEFGITGDFGPSGPGVTGEKGNMGLRGFPGTTGIPGKGIPGEKGKQGSVGLPGQRGASRIGPAGSKGEPGFPGDPGTIGKRGVGEPGPKGDAGAEGLPGDPGDSGEDGTMGPKGDAGLPGPNGQDGPPGRGLPGDKGDRGKKGPRGQTGQAGPPGPAGEKGDQGDSGLPGVPGPSGRGRQGPKGDPGPFGPPGPAGDPAMGSSGPKGEAGLPGPIGPAGLKGDGFPGPPGPPGLPGLIGEVGLEETGLPGPKGERGPPGASGPAGPPGLGQVGPKGSTGLTGEVGSPGSQDEGLQGPKGDPGDQGLRGLKGSPEEGLPGQKGDRGLPGAQGPKGNRGKNGDPGLTGEPGDSGPDGESSLTTLEIIRLIQSTCGCGRICRVDPLELVFVIDSSESVGPENFQLIKDFVITVLDHVFVGPEVTRVGAIVYSHITRVVSSIKDDSSPDHVKEAVRTMPYIGEGTYTGSGIKQANELFLFARPGVRKVAVVITDGLMDQRDPVKLRDVVQEAHSANITLLVIVNQSHSDGDDSLNVFKTITSPPSQEHVFYITDFQLLPEVESQLLREICDLTDVSVFNTFHFPDESDQHGGAGGSVTDPSSDVAERDDTITSNYLPEFSSQKTFSRNMSVRSESRPGDECLQPLDQGPCTHYVAKWYFDPISNSCAQFWFGGCHGNKNRFDTELSCTRTCVKK